jgi:hypothetical protein
MVDVQEANPRTRTFRGSRFWVFNAQGATLAGIAGILLMSVVAFNDLLVGGKTRIGAALLLYSIGALLCFYWPGNLIAMFPYEITIETGKGLWIHSVFRKTYITSADLRDLRHTAVGTSVHLKRRQRLMRHFYIHWFFGPESGPLAEAIRGEILHRAA